MECSRVEARGVKLRETPCFIVAEAGVEPARPLRDTGF